MVAGVSEVWRGSVPRLRPGAHRQVSSQELLGLQVRRHLRTRYQWQTKNRHVRDAWQLIHRCLNTLSPPEIGNCWQNLLWFDYQRSLKLWRSLWTSITLSGEDILLKFQIWILSNAAYMSEKSDLRTTRQCNILPSTWSGIRHAVKQLKYNSFCLFHNSM